MMESEEVELGGRVSCKRKGGRGDWKRATYSVIEFLLQLISHIHFIILSLLHATVCCRKSVLISVCMHNVRFHAVCLCVYSSRLTVCMLSSCVYIYALLICFACIYCLQKCVTAWWFLLLSFGICCRMTDTMFCVHLLSIFEHFSFLLHLNNRLLPFV